MAEVLLQVCGIVQPVVLCWL